MSAVEGVRETTLHRLDAIITRLENPNARMDLDTRVYQHRAYFENLKVLRRLGCWDELNTYYTLFNSYLKRRGDL